MELTTARLRLVPLNTSFFDSTKEYTTDPENTRFMVHLPKASDREVMEFLRCCENEWSKIRPSFYEFAVLYQNQHIGSASLYFNSDGSGAELGYIFHRNYHGCGFATECAERLVSLCREIGVGRVTAHCDSENTPSAKVLSKIGMRLNGISYGRRNRINNGIRYENSYELLL